MRANDDRFVSLIIEVGYCIMSFTFCTCAVYTRFERERLLVPLFTFWNEF